MLCFRGLVGAASDVVFGLLERQIGLGTIGTAIITGLPVEAVLRVVGIFICMKGGKVPCRRTRPGRDWTRVFIETIFDDRAMS